MGTRNLTLVVCNKEYVVAQYCQWGGHPDGQGKTVLAFCRDRLAHAPGRDDFMLRLSKCTFINSDEVEKRFNERATPQFSRNMGAKVLEFIWNRDEPTQLFSSLDFAADSLFCEYAWVIDLDKNTFEGFKGFNKQKLPETERFSFLNAASHQDYRAEADQYFPVKFVAGWSLDSLPTDEDFYKAFADPDEEVADETAAQ